MLKQKKKYHYDRHCYDHEGAVSGYEKRPYYGGVLGRYRKYRERRAIHCAVQQFTRDSVILDCPCGYGRWFYQLGTRASRIIGIDAAKVMVEAARERHLPGVELQARVGDAEHLNLADNSVDHVFSYALMKHLPPSLRLKVLKEFARVSTGRIAVSFGIANYASFYLWRLRGSRGPDPTWWTDVEAMASEASLLIGAIYRSGVPAIGMETIVVFERTPS